jgi:hypothetical protein
VNAGAYACSPLAVEHDIAQLPPPPSSFGYLCRIITISARRLEKLQLLLPLRLVLRCPVRPVRAAAGAALTRQPHHLRDAAVRSGGRGPHGLQDHVAAPARHVAAAAASRSCQNALRHGRGAREARGRADHTPSCSSRGPRPGAKSAGKRLRLFRGGGRKGGAVTAVPAALPRARVRNRPHTFHGRGGLWRAPRGEGPPGGGGGRALLLALEHGLVDAPGAAPDRVHDL